MERLIMLDEIGELLPRKELWLKKKDEDDNEYLELSFLSENDGNKFSCIVRPNHKKGDCCFYCQMKAIDGKIFQGQYLLSGNYYMELKRFGKVELKSVIANIIEELATHTIKEFLQRKIVS